MTQGDDADRLLTAVRAAIVAEFKRQIPTVCFWDPADEDLVSGDPIEIRRFRGVQGNVLLEKADKFDMDAVAAAAIEAMKPEGTAPVVRVLIDLSGGLFESVISTVPVEVMAVDEADQANPRARLPGDDFDVWAEIQEAEVDPDRVNAAFDGIKWIDEDA
jgi:hypothetical protein